MSVYPHVRFFLFHTHLFHTSIIKDTLYCILNKLFFLTKCFIDLKINMKYLKLFLNKSLIFFFIEYFGLAVETSLLSSIRQEHYNISIKSLDNNFTGICHIFINISQPTLNIKLHAQQPQVTILTLNLTKLNTLRETKWNVNVYENINHTLNYYFTDYLLPGDYLLQIEFCTIINNAGESLFKIPYTNARNET